MFIDMILRSGSIEKYVIKCYQCLSSVVSLDSLLVLPLILTDIGFLRPDILNEFLTSSQPGDCVASDSRMILELRSMT